MACYMVDLPKVPAAAKRAGVQTEPASLIRARPVNHAASSRGTVFAPALHQYIHDVIDGKSYFDPLCRRCKLDARAFARSGPFRATCARRERAR